MPLVGEVDELLVAAGQPTAIAIAIAIAISIRYPWAAARALPEADRVV